MGQMDRMTTGELQRLADSKFREAEVIEDEKAKLMLRRTAENLQFTAKLKGWLNSELRPPE
jgi:hypothetical protein